MWAVVLIISGILCSSFVSPTCININKEDSDGYSVGGAVFAGSNILTGDNQLNDKYRGFVKFPKPSVVGEIKLAKLNLYLGFLRGDDVEGSPPVGVGNVIVDHIPDYTAVGNPYSVTAYNSNIGTLVTSSDEFGWKSLSVISYVSQDISNNRDTSFRIRSEIETDNDGKHDWYGFYTIDEGGVGDPLKNPYLIVCTQCGDIDNDGYGEFGTDLSGCTGSTILPDCDDNNPSIHSSVEEICGNGIDEDCSGADLPCPCIDSDLDSYPSLACGGTDCDNNNILVYPGAAEICDSVDNNCNGIIDDIPPTPPSQGIPLTDIYSQSTNAIQTPTGYGVVWQQSEYNPSISMSQWQVYFVETDNNGVNLSAPIKISTSVAPMQAWQPSVAWDGSRFGIVWEQHDLNANTYEVYFATVDSSGTVTAPKQIGGLGSFLPKIVWSGSSYGVLWLDLPSQNLFFLEIDSNGNVLNTGKKSITSDGAQSFSNPVWNPADSRYISAWDKNLGADNYDIFISLFDIHGGNVVEKRVTNEIGRSQNPSIILNNDLNEYAVVWEEERKISWSEYHKEEIYFTRLDSDGNKKDLNGDTNIDSNDDIRVTTDNLICQYPTIAWNDIAQDYGITYFRESAEGSGIRPIYFTRVKPGSETANYADMQITETQQISWEPKIFAGASNYVVFYYGTLAVAEFQNARSAAFDKCGQTIAVCGNNLKEDAEACDRNVLDGKQCTDFGATGGTLSCLLDCTGFDASLCTNIVCGNGVVDMGEQCDDSNNIDCDGCINDCSRPDNACGDGMLECGEVCDDSNTADNDGCSASCLIETCGDGIVQKAAWTGHPIERCDDGNNMDGDGCSAECTVEPKTIYLNIPKIANIYKANIGFIGEDVQNFVFDINDDGTSDYTKSSTVFFTEKSDFKDTLKSLIESCPEPLNGVCRIPVKISTDSGMIAITSIDIEYTNYYWDTSSVPDSRHYRVNVSVQEAKPFCGNGLVESGEYCDDGNMVTGDGCSAFCRDEYCGDLVCGVGEDCAADDCCGGLPIILESDLNNCGSCGHACWDAANAAEQCSTGTCTLICDTGYADCNGLYDDGCEVYLQSDPNNCGSCGNVCAAGESCTAGTCTPPPVTPDLICAIKSSCDAAAGEIGLFSLYRPYNSHVGTMDYYLNDVCCRIEGRTLGADCSAAGKAVIFSKFRADDSHVSLTPAYYDDDVCLSVDSGIITCHIYDGTGICDTGTCITTVFDGDGNTDDSHVAGCAGTPSPYTKTICCEYTAQAAACGDGAIDAGEFCDDGNDINGDGCSSSCTYEGACADVCSDVYSTSGTCRQWAVGVGTICNGNDELNVGPTGDCFVPEGWLGAIYGCCCTKP